MSATPLTDAAKFYGSGCLANPQRLGDLIKDRPVSQTPLTDAMTPKQRVLKKYPFAACFGLYIYRNARPGVHRDSRTLGYGLTPRAAWADAAKRIKK